MIVGGAGCCLDMCMNERKRTGEKLSFLLLSFLSFVEKKLSFFSSFCGESFVCRSLSGVCVRVELLLSWFLFQFFPWLSDYTASERESRETERERERQALRSLPSREEEEGEKKEERGGKYRRRLLKREGVCLDRRGEGSVRLRLLSFLLRLLCRGFSLSILSMMCTCVCVCLSVVSRSFLSADLLCVFVAWRSSFPQLAGEDLEKLRPLSLSFSPFSCLTFSDKSR